MATDQYTPQNPATQYPGPEVPGRAAARAGAGVGDGAEARPRGVDLPRHRPPRGPQDHRDRRRLGHRRAVAIAFAREGADVVLSYLPEEEPDARQVVGLVEEAGRAAVAVPGDLSDAATCLRADRARRIGARRASTCWSSTRASRLRCPDIAELTSEQFDQTLKTNVYAMFWLCKAALRHMPAGRRDHHHLFGSGLRALAAPPRRRDDEGRHQHLQQGAGPAARAEGDPGERGRPGPVWTPLQVSGWTAGGEAAGIRRPDAAGRAGQPAELAPPYVFLASQESSYVTGSTLSVTGGKPTP